jgi:uncharacterized protein DUF5343
MSSGPNLPYVLAPSRVEPLLNKIRDAQTPPRFTQDFLETKLSMKGGSATALIPLLKRIGFLQNDGTPTELYRRYRNPDTSGAALAEGLRKGYGELYSRNEYAHDLTRDKLTNVIVEITGKSKDDRLVKAVVGTYWALKEKADFESPVASQGKKEEKKDEKKDDEVKADMGHLHLPMTFVPDKNVGLNLSYTINLNLPETDDINVYNAIFKSLKENMLKG